MSEHDDEYLWSGQGSASEDVAAIERTLGRLRWRPQPLVLPSEVEAEPARSSWWPALAAGLVAAAAVLAVLLWAKLDAGSSNPERAIQPTAPPSSPDLEDPFEPITDAPEPQVAPTISPDLKDPFEGTTEPPKPAEPRPRPREGESPDLKNPFHDSDELVDPYRSRRKSPGDSAPSGTSPDLKDPFAR
jgi:hypothetical protein